jgi:hypothetical protein
VKDPREIKFVARTRGIAPFMCDTYVQHSRVETKESPYRVRVIPELFFDEDMSDYCDDLGAPDTKFFMAGALTNAAIMYHYGDVISLVDDDFGLVSYGSDCFLDFGDCRYVKIWQKQYPKNPKPMIEDYPRFIRMAYRELGADHVVQLGTYGKPAEVLDPSLDSYGNPLWPYCTQGFITKSKISTFWFTPSILDTKKITKPTLPYIRHEDSYLGLVNPSKTVVLPAFIHHIGRRVPLSKLNPLDFVVQKYIMQARSGIINKDIEPPRSERQQWLEDNFHRLCLECESLPKEKKREFVEAIFFHGEMP